MAPKVKVAVSDYIEADLDWEAEQMAERGLEFACHQLKYAQPPELIEALHDADIILVNMAKITREVIAGLDKCRMMIRHGAGYDNVDVSAMTEKGILFQYVPDYCSEEVAEQAIALILACGRKIVWSIRDFQQSVAQGSWNYDTVVPMYRIEGKTVGIVGCGRIGSLVYRKLESFGVKFRLCDPYLSEKRKKAFNTEFVDLETVCRESDYITVHTPLNDETRHIMNAKTISYMKPGAYLINTSRGGMVDHDALASALKENRIAGAAIDVFEDEPPKPDFPLLGLDNAILTPHVSWYSKDAEQSIREKIVQTIDMFLDGSGARFPVNPEVLEKD